jgi:hypothetical protein
MNIAIATDARTIKGSISVTVGTINAVFVLHFSQSLNLSISQYFALYLSR